MTVKDASLSILQRADGSAKCDRDGYSVVGAVNGPIEVQRRDELPEEAAIEINVRPAIGVGSMPAGTKVKRCFAMLNHLSGPTERHLESLLQSSLRHVIMVQNYPRTLIQVTLQILEVPDLNPTPISVCRDNQNQYIDCLPADTFFG